MVRFRILALSGGGTKGFLQLGAIQELESHVGNLTRYFDKGIYGCSVGSLLATGIAFGIPTEKTEQLYKKLVNFDFIMNSLSIDLLKNSMTRKGIFEMDGFERTVLSGFDSCGIDLRDKVLSDAQIPLYIVSSNMTKGVPTIFKGNVPVLMALRASCCIPGIFRPQIIKNQVYIDGGYFTNVLFKLISKEDQAYSLAIDIVHTSPGITPAGLEDMSVNDFLYKLYKQACLYEVASYKHPNILNVSHSGGSGFGNPTETEKTDMLLSGKSFMRGFLAQTRF